MKNWFGNKKMNLWSSSESEELKIPVLRNRKDATQRDGFSDSGCENSLCVKVLMLFLTAALICILSFLLFNDYSAKSYFTTYNPEIRLDSLIYCSTNTSNNNNLAIFDLKFDIKNTNNASRIYIYPLEVSIFSGSYRENKLILSKTVHSETCVYPTNRTIATVLADVSLNPNDYLTRNGTMRFDFKIHGHFWFQFLPSRDDYEVDLVCEDAKVDLLTSCNSSCASMVGDPFMCSYV